MSGQSAPKKKRYIFFDLLSFLRPTAVSTSDERESNISPSPSTQHSDIEENILMRPPRQKKILTKKKQKENIEIPQITKILNESLQLQKDNKDSDAKGNRAFLLSFVPIMNAMTPELAMETRFQITNLFRNIQRNETNSNIPIETNPTIPSNLTEFIYRKNQDSRGSSSSREYSQAFSPISSVASPQNDTASDTSMENDNYFNVISYLPLN